jgi:predicted  nucleic acid-binding Zn-ribbon protein
VAVLSAEQADLRTRAAVLEEQGRAGRADVERVEKERDELRAQTARLREEHGAAAAAAAEARARGDAAAAQHAEAVRSYLSSQVCSAEPKHIAFTSVGVHLR